MLDVTDHDAVAAAVADLERVVATDLAGRWGRPEEIASPAVPTDVRAVRNRPRSSA